MEQITPRILVYSENNRLLAELIGKARQVADPLGWEVAALQTQAVGPEDPLLNGADFIYQSTHPVSPFEPETIASLLLRVINEKQPRLLLIGATRSGLEVAPQIAESVQASYATWVTDFQIEPGTFTINASTLLYSGVGAADFAFIEPIVILCVAQGVFEPIKTQQNKLTCLYLDYQPEPGKVKVIGYREKPTGNTSLGQAPAVIDLGQGVRTDDNLEMINELAGLIGAQLACTRPVATERNWFPDWLGLSGMKVTPKLSLALGVSGAIQHVIGIRGSQCITSINNDESAAIFSQSDYSVVADLYEFVPALVERLKARNIQPC